MDRFHWCTVACFRLGSAAAIAVATFAAAGAGESRLDGFTIGGGNCVGKPPANLTLVGTVAQPVVDVPCTEATQRNVAPGTVFASPVAKNVETGSKEMP